MDDKNFGLSRRKMLAGLGIVGVASAGAGLGTTAYFSDSESFEDNTITAGQFELHATQTIHTVDQDGGPDEVAFNKALAALDDPEADVVEGTLDIKDAKPGDSYKVCWDPCVKYNPGYIQITLSSEETAGNDQDPPVTHVDADGLLGDFMLAVVTITGQDGVGGVAFAGTLGDLVEDFENGGLIHATAEYDVETGEEISAEYCHDPCELMEGADGEPADAVEVCVHLYLPSGGDVGGSVDVAGVVFEIDAEDSPGNAVQGASFEADIVFEAEQCRHNENPFQNGVENDHDDDDDEDDNTVVDDSDPE